MATSNKSQATPRMDAARSKKKPTRGISLAGLAAVIEDACVAGAAPDAGPAEPSAYGDLMKRLLAVQSKFPPVYEQHMVAPFIATLQKLGVAQFKRLLARDPNRESDAGMMFDVAQAILQHGEGHAQAATRAFQEFISDLYDGFLSAEDRKGVKAPDLGVVPPLVKWGAPEAGPYTWPVDATQSLDVDAGVVSLPPANARSGLVAWAALGHETAGHDILHADSGLQDELAQALRTNLKSLGSGLADYWASRIDETSSDVMGILNLGPVAGIGLIAYFRGLAKSAGAPPRLGSEGPDDDPHPADIVRGYLAAEVVALLKFAGASAWAQRIAAETDRDCGTIVLAGHAISATLARQSAKVVAQTLVQYRAQALEQHALGEIQNWADADEAIVQALRPALRDGTALPPTPGGAKLYAAHLVAAAVTEALATGHDIPGLQQRLIQALNTLHDRNPAWGPLFVLHRGDIRRDFFVPAVWRRFQA